MYCVFPVTRFSRRISLAQAETAPDSQWIASAAYADLMHDTDSYTANSGVSGQTYGSSRLERLHDRFNHKCESRDGPDMSQPVEIGRKNAFCLFIRCIKPPERVSQFFHALVLHTCSGNAVKESDC